MSSFVKGTQVYKCLAVNHVELILQRKIKVKYSENKFNISKKNSFKSIYKALARGCRGFYPSVDKLSFNNM